MAYAPAFVSLPPHYSTNLLGQEGGKAIAEVLVRLTALVSLDLR